MPPSPFSPTYNMKEVAEQEIDLQTTLQRRKLANMSRQSGGGGPRTLPKPIIKNCSNNVTTENSVHFNTVSFWTEEANQVWYEKRKLFVQ